MPDVPDSIRQAIAAYSGMTANIFMGWDPKSGAMLISSTGHDTRQLHLLLSPGGEIRLTTLFPDEINSGSFMPKTGDEVVFAADHAGDEFYQLYRLDPANGQTKLLTDGDSLNLNTIYDHTGQQVAFLSTMHDAKYNDIYVMNPRKPEDRRILMSPHSGGWILQDWAEDGGHILVSHIRSINDGYLWSISTASGETTMVTKDKGSQIPYLVARYTPHDEGIYAIVPVPGGMDQFTIVYLHMTNEGPVRKVPSNVTKAMALELSPDGTWLAYITEDHDSAGFHIFNTLTGEELPPPALAPGYFRTHALEGGQQRTPASITPPIPRRPSLFLQNCDPRAGCSGPSRPSTISRVSR